MLHGIFTSVECIFTMSDYTFTILEYISTTADYIFTMLDCIFTGLYEVCPGAVAIMRCTPIVGRAIADTLNNNI